MNPKSSFLKVVECFSGFNLGDKRKDMRDLPTKFSVTPRRERQNLGKMSSTFFVMCAWTVRRLKDLIDFNEVRYLPYSIQGKPKATLLIPQVLFFLFTPWRHKRKWMYSYTPT